jgi:hypothetical protein
MGNGKISHRGELKLSYMYLLLTALKAADRRPQAKPPQYSLQQLLQHGTDRANSSVRFSSLVALTKSLGVLQGCLHLE